MKASEKFFYMFYSLTSDNGSVERYLKTSYLITAALTAFVSLLCMFIVQYLKFKPNSFVFWILLVSCIGVVCYLLTNAYYIKSGRYKRIIKVRRGLEKEKQAFFYVVTLSLCMLALIVLFVIGMIISYIYVIYH